MKKHFLPTGTDVVIKFLCIYLLNKLEFSLKKLYYTIALFLQCAHSLFISKRVGSDTNLGWVELGLGC